MFLLYYKMVNVMKSIILIVLDASTWKYIDKHLDELPTFKYLKRKYKHGILHNNIQIYSQYAANFQYATGTIASSIALYTGKAKPRDFWTEKKPHQLDQRTRQHVKAPFIWELIPNSIAISAKYKLHNHNFPKIKFPSCKLTDVPFESFWINIRKKTKILADKSELILKNLHLNFFTVFLTELDVPSHYLWREKVARRVWKNQKADPFFQRLTLITYYRDIDDLIKKVLPYLEKSLFIVCGNHGFDSYENIRRKIPSMRPQGHPSITGEHDIDSIIITNMDLVKNLTEIFPMVLKYAKKEGMIK